MTSRSGNKNYNESDNSPIARENKNQMIRFIRSDGDATSRPTNLDRTPVNGQVNYHRKVFLNEGPATKWRKSIGNELARLLDYDTSKAWYIEDWPAGYECFVHCKGPVDDYRTDLYLFGGPSRFRSSNEFIPHAYWLMTDPTLNRKHCECKYCGGTKLQKQINLQHNLPGPTAEIRASPELGESSTHHSNRVPRRPAPDHPLLPPPALNFTAVNANLEADLRMQRPYRLGEIVWVILDPPLPLDSQPDGVSARCWPAVVVEHRFHPTIIQEDGKPFTTTQTREHKVAMLVVTAEYVFPESKLLPFIAYRVSESMQAFITKYAADVKAQPDACHQLLAQNWFRAVQPLPNPIRTSADLFKSEDSAKFASPPVNSPSAALMAYSIALRMSKTVAHYWCVTDEFEFTLNIGGDEPPEKQIRYQGLLWGPERIWEGDLVRIRLTRSGIAGDFLPPSPGSESRGLFLKLEALYLEPQVDSNGQAISPKHMISGSLFELAPANFEEQAPTSLSGSRKLPQPPIGYKFRSITPSADFDAHFEIRHLAGRYYPHLNQTSDLPEGSDLYRAVTRNVPRLLGVENPEGCCITVDAYVPGRSAMLVNSETHAIKKIFQNCRLPDLQTPATPSAVSTSTSLANGAHTLPPSGYVPSGSTTGSPSRFPMLASPDHNRSPARSGP